MLLLKYQELSYTALIQCSNGRKLGEIILDILSVEFLSGLVSIIIIDLILAGDNALLIGLATKNLPGKQQKKAIIWGTFGAIFIRIVLTLFAVKLLQIDGLLLIGGIVLVYISYKLLLSDNELEMNSPKKNFWGAVWTILVADLLMGVDNVIAVAGAAHGSYLLVVIGLLISIPIVVWGSTLVIKIIEKFPFIIGIGAGVLAWTASKMIVKDAYMIMIFHNKETVYIFEILVVLAVISLGSLVNRHKREAV